jgi:hypothetical protein
MAIGQVSPTPAHVKAHARGRWVETLFRALSSRVVDRWKFVSFRGKNNAEWRGVVDLIAIRKASAQPDGELLKRGDLFDIVLIQNQWRHCACCWAPLRRRQR